jgi:hypothetical protein
MGRGHMVKRICSEDIVHGIPQAFPRYRPLKKVWVDLATSVRDRVS